MSMYNRLKGRFQTQLFLFIIFVSILLFNRCDETSQEYILGKEFVESQTELNLIDTFTVSLSTVILDTVVTSGTGQLLIGSYHDDVFGKMTSHSYFQLGIPDSFDIEDYDIYDSLNLVIRYDNYSFGDTMVLQKIYVHKLIESIEFEEDDLISGKTTFNYDPDPIGSIIYTPEPNSTIDTLKIKIRDDIGLDIFMKAIEHSEILEDNETFNNHFHGLVLAADDAYQGSIVGFNASAEDVKLILYTSRGVPAEQIKHEFRLTNATKQFNNIVHDFTATQLSTLLDQRNEISSINTGGLSFLQGGTGLVIRVDFPSLPEILLRDRGKIVEAQLSLSPLSTSYHNIDLPVELHIYQSDKLNRRHESVLNNQGGIVTSTLILDELYNEETAYLFDMTKYLNDELADWYIDPDNGLLITLPSDDLETGFSRLIMDAHNPKTKLKIYYLSY